jgi:thioredoxin reductase (NADPH)
MVELQDEALVETDVPTNYPTVELANGRVLTRLENSELADALGITELPDSSEIFDVAVVGAGPGGLAAAVYAASEGLSTVVIEGVAPGGQAGTSSKIENYLGFPTGIGGQQLAIRALMQALKFGVEFAIARAVVSVIPKRVSISSFLRVDTGYAPDPLLPQPERNTVPWLSQES